MAIAQEKSEFTTIPPFKRRREMFWHGRSWDSVLIDDAILYLVGCLVGGLMSHFLFDGKYNDICTFVAFLVFFHFSVRANERSKKRYQQYVDDYHLSLQPYSQDELKSLGDERLRAGDSLTANVIELHLRRRQLITSPEAQASGGICNF